MGISIVFGIHGNIWIIFEYLLAFFPKFVPKMPIFLILGKIGNATFVGN